MYSIPDYIRKINITMGYPAHNTSVASCFFVVRSEKLAKQEGQTTYYYYKPVVALLNQ